MSSARPSSPIPARPIGWGGRSLVLAGGWVVGVLAAAVSLAACGPSEPSRQDLRAALRDAGMSNDQARCVADAVVGDLSADEVKLIMRVGPAGAPTDDTTVDHQSIDRFNRSMTRCRELGPSTTSTTVPTTAAGGVATSTTVAAGSQETTSTTAADGRATTTTAP